MTEEKNFSPELNGIKSYHSRKIIYEGPNIGILTSQNEDLENGYYNQNTISDVTNGIDKDNDTDYILEKQDIDELDDFYSHDLDEDPAEKINEIEELRKKFEQIKSWNFPISVKIKLMESIK